MPQLFCCQLDMVWEDKPANQARVREWLGKRRPPAGSLVLLPEMFATGFSMNVAGIAEGDPAPTEAFLRNLAQEFGVSVVGGLVRRHSDGRGRNEAVAFSPEGNLLARYCKIHPFTFGGESRHYAGGQEIVSFSWGGLLVTPFICYDLRFPEIFRAAVRQGTELFVVIANWPAKRQSHWITLLKARAIENQAYVAGVNRCGNDPKLAYSGRSLILDPQGEVLADAGEQEGIIAAELDAAHVHAWRAEFPALADSRWRDVS